MTPDFWVGVDGVDFCSDAHWKIFSTTELTSVITVQLDGAPLLRQRQHGTYLMKKIVDRSSAVCQQASQKPTAAMSLQRQVLAKVTEVKMADLSSRFVTNRNFD